MKVIKKHKFSLIVVLLALIFLIAASMGTYSVFARTVTIDGSNFFYANGDSSVRAYQEISGDDTNYYTMFHYVSDEDNVTYRYNLAYHWYQAQEADGNGDIDYSAGVEGWFNLTIGFDGYDFDRYVIKFQSQQYTETEDGVTTNYIVFVPDGAGSVYCYITYDEDDCELTATELETLSASSSGNEYPKFSVTNSDGLVNRITIAFYAYSAGEYSVLVSDENGVEGYGTFTNVGGTYAKRVNSTTNGVMPLTFTAYLDEDNEDASCDMVLFTLNNQNFLLSDASAVETGNDDGDNETYYTGSSVADDCAPVLCLEGNLSYVEYGEALDFDYVVIDVLASSPKSVIHYYVLSAEIYNAAVSSGSASYFLDDTTDDTTGESLFDKTSDDADYLLVESTDPFLTDEIYNTNGDDGYTVGCLVMVYVELTDVTSSTNNNATTNVYLNWYIDSADLANVEVNGESCGFIKALTDEQGATYVARYNENGDESEEFNKLVENYQAEIDELAYDENGNIALSAGSTSKIYLPAFTGFITDNLDGYEDLTYSIYYTIDGSQNSSSSLSYNELSISLSSAGTYRFTIYATDSASNNMYYIDADGELVEFTTSEVYDDEVKDYLPWFTFEVIYKGVTIEDPGEQTTGYVDSEYSVSSFEINGVSDYYTTAYSLYIFDRAAFIEETGESLTYAEYVANVQALFENTYLLGEDGEYVNTRAYFKEIKEYSSLNENDDDYDDFVDYEWSSSSLSFIPQDENSYYLVKLTVTDTYYKNNVTVLSYMGIHVSAAADSYSGESDWLANNLASVILFSIAGAALIAIIVLFIIKPKDEGDLDEQLANEAEGIKAKQAKKAKKSKKKKDEE